MDQEQINEKICNAVQQHFRDVPEPINIPKVYMAVTIKYQKTGESIDNIVSELAYQYKTWNEQKCIWQQYSS